MSEVVFVAWRRASVRTVELAERLGAELIVVRDRPPYLRAYLETGRLLEEKRPRVVIVQLPQGPLLYRVARLRDRLGFRLVADVHTAMVVYDGWKGVVLNRPFLRYLRRADLVLVHNEPLARLLDARLGLRDRLMVVYDPPARLEPRAAYEGLEPRSYILLPASWAPDEDVEGVVRAYCDAAPRLRLVVTGDYRRRGARPPVCRGVVYTGFVERSVYNWLVSNARIVIAETRREYTFLRSAWEALSAGRPALIASTETLRSIYRGYSGFYESPEGLRRLLSRVDELTPILEDEFAALRAELLRESEEMLERLRARLEELSRR